MQIPKEFLEEKNYEGSRLIEINDPMVTKLHGELKKFQQEANPTLEKMEKLTPILDPFYARIGEIEKEKNKIKEEMQPTREEYDKYLEVVQKIDQRAQLVKNKITPMVNKIVEGQLGEFEKASQLIEKDDKIFVEVVDEIEEKIKSIRMAKAKK